MAQHTPGGLPFLRTVKPSYLVLFALAPLVVYLFVYNPVYQSSLKFIFPGIGLTLLLTVFGYLLAAVWGLILAGMQFLKLGRGTLRGFLIAGTAFVLVSLGLLLLPKNAYVLVGAADGTVAIVQGTPRSLSDAVRGGTYREGAAVRDFRAVPDAATALDRIRSGTYTGALIPKAALPEGEAVLWEISVTPQPRINLFSGLLAVGGFLLLLVFGGWQSGEHPLAIFAELYIDVIRGIPMLVIILFIGLVLPGELAKLNILLEPNNEFLRNLQRGTLAIGLAYAAYMAEIFRAGIQAVPRGQTEAARTLGLTGLQTVRFIVLPQALRVVIPPLGNEFIAMLKDTAIISLIGTEEMTRLARSYGAATLNNIPPYNTAAVLYIVLTLSASSLLKWIERRTGAGETR
ncbi:hypothetical protein BH24DEI2_BH24DEI2_09790 [soil metagenome]